jgi:hypothetical protein
MKANELRIGNMVSFCNGISPKEIITIQGRFFTSFTDKYPSVNNYYKPIPLTEEWLVKFGFMKFKRGYKLKNFGQFIIMGDKLAFYPAGILDAMFRWDLLQYVHQLQNLYFALTGNELEITKNEKL